MAVKPISPDEVGEGKVPFPDEVFEAFNELIRKYFYRGAASFQQEEVEKLMIEKGLTEDDIHEKHWLDIEGEYERQGWIVEYDKSGYNETTPAVFKFTKGKKPKKSKYRC